MMLNLQNNILSRQDLRAVLLEIKDYAKWFGQADIQQQVTGAAASGQPALSPAAADLIGQWHEGKQASRETLDSLLAALEEVIAKTPTVTVTLAGPAPAALRQAVVEWFRRNVSPDLLVDFSFNSTMLGGMMVRYGSHVYDWSFKRQIMANRTKFAEILRNV